MRCHLARRGHGQRSECPPGGGLRFGLGRAERLALHRTQDGQPFHVVWGFARGATSPVVLVTAYRRIQTFGRPTFYEGDGETPQD